MKWIDRNLEITELHMLLAGKQRELTFTRWVSDYSDLLFQYSFKRLDDYEISKDLVQETFLSAWRNMDSYRGEASEKNWLFAILKNKIVDHFRRLHANREIEMIRMEYNDHNFFDPDEHWTEGMYPAAIYVNFSSAAESKEFQSLIQSCSKRLKRIQRAVFVMKYMDDLDSREICKVLGITSSNYWVIMHRAKVQLRECLQRNWEKQ